MGKLRHVRRGGETKMMGEEQERGVMAGTGAIWREQKKGERDGEMAIGGLLLGARYESDGARFIFVFSRKNGENKNCIF